MAVAFVGSLSSAEDAENPTIAHTVPTGTDRLLIVGVSDGNADGDPTGITWNTTENFTKLRTQNDGGDLVCSLWYLIAPTEGAHNVVVSGTGDVHHYGVLSFVGVDQTTAFITGHDNGATDIEGSPTVGVTSASGELVVDVACCTREETSLTVGAGQTERQNTTQPEPRQGMSTEAGSDGTVTMSWTAGDETAWVQIGASMNDAVAAVPPAAFLKRMEHQPAPNPLLRM